MESTPNIDYANQAVVDNVRGMKGWLKFMGIVMIVTGALQALTIVGIIWAWLPIWLGVLLNQAGSRASEFAMKRDTGSLASFTAKMKTYFVVSGVVMIVSFGLAVLAFIGGIVAAIVTGATMPGLLEQLQDSYR